MKNCVFCSIVSDELPSWQIFEDEHCLAILDIAPAAPGHTLVLPKTHVPDIFATSDDLASRLAVGVLRTATLLRDRLAPDGLSIFQSNGEAAWQEVPHLHVHLVPRKWGDQLVRPWNSAAVASSDLNAVHRALRGHG